MRRFFRRTRVRLTLASTAIVLAVTSVGAGVYWFLFSTAQLRTADATLFRAEGQLLASGIVANGNGYRFRQPLGAQGTADTAVAGIEDLLLSGSNSVLDASAPAPPVATVAAVVARAPHDRTALLDTVKVSGESERVLVRRIQLPLGGGQATLVLTLSTAGDDDALGRTAIFLVVAIATITATTALSSYWQAGRVLRPVREITGMARDMSEHNLDQRITLSLPDDEIGDLATTFNGMLARLEAGFAALRRFTADAAHELRAPLAVLMTEADVALKRARSVEAYRATLVTVLAETERLSQVANQLLTLARADAGALAPSLEDVEISDLVEDLVDRWRGVASQRSVTINTKLPDSGRVRVDVEMMRSLVDNLMSNAVRHARSDGAVTVTARIDTAVWTLSVEDDGTGVPADSRAGLFERFSRVQRGRDRATGGAGLGLSICVVVAHLHGGTLALDPDPAHPARFVVTLPIASTVPPHEGGTVHKGVDRGGGRRGGQRQAG